MGSGSTRRTSRATTRTTRGGGGGMKTGSAMGMGMVILFIIAALGAYMVYQDGVRKKELAAANATTPVIVAATELKAGKQLTPQDITIKQVKVGSVEPGAFTDASDPSLIGGTLVVNISGNQTILRNYIGVPEERLAPKEGEREATITLKGQDANDSFLRKGQEVSVFRVFTTASGNRITQSLSKRARILDVKKNDSLAANAQGGGEAQALTTLAVSPEDAQRILQYRDSGEVKLLDGPNQEPPPSRVSLFQAWRGVEQEESELTSEVGGTLMAKEAKSG